MSKLSSLNDVHISAATANCDTRGQLYVYQNGTQFPFEINRVFTIYADNGALRGNHAHILCKQVLVCVKGQCRVVCKDGDQTVEHILDTPNQALYIPPGIWGEQEYLSDDTVLMVLCDRPYDESDYLREWDAFLTWRQSAGDEV